MKKEFDQDALLTQAEISEKKRREELNDIAINNDEAAIELSEQELAVEDVIADAGAIATDASLAAEATVGATGISTTALVGGGLAAIGGGLALSGGSSDSNDEAEPAAKEPAQEPEAAKPVNETRTVSEADVTEFINTNTEDKAFAIQLSGDGQNTLNLENGDVTPPKGFVVSSVGDLVINAENASGAIVVNTTKSVVANLGEGTADITTGLGDDRIILAANSLGKGDVINAGQGADTLVLSGDDSNLIGGEDGAELNSVETIELNSVVEFASLTDLDGVTVKGNVADSKVIINVGVTDYVDLSETDLTGLKELDLVVDLPVEGSQQETAASIELNEATATSLQSLTIDSDDLDALTLVGNAASIKALIVGDVVAEVIANDVALSVSVEDSGEAIDALLNDADFAKAVEAANISVEAGALTVAEALSLLETGVDLEYSLEDTAENLALAPSVVFGESQVGVVVAGSASVSQANSIIALTTNVELNVADTASNIATLTQFKDVLVSSITITDVATFAEAQAASEKLAANGELTVNILDSVENIVPETGPVTDIAGVDTITVTDTDELDAADIEAIVEVYGDAVATGYEITGTLTELQAAPLSIEGASKVIVEGVNTIVQASEVIALKGGEKIFAIEDDIEAFLLASDSVIAAATDVTFVTGEKPAADLITRLFDLVGEGLAVDTAADTVANLAAMSQGALATIAELDVVEGTTDVATYAALLNDVTAINDTRGEASNDLNVAGGTLKDTGTNLATENGAKASAVAEMITITGTTSLADAITIAAQGNLAKTSFEKIAGDFATLERNTDGDFVNKIELYAALAKAAAIEITNVAVIEIPSNLAMNAELVYDLADAADVLAADAMAMNNARNIKAIDGAKLAEAKVIFAATNDVTNDAASEPQPNGNTTTFSIDDVIDDFVTDFEDTAALKEVLDAAVDIKVTGDVDLLVGAEDAVAAIIAAGGELSATGTAAAIADQITASEVDDPDGKAVKLALDSISDFTVGSETITNVDAEPNDSIIADLTKIIESGIDAKISITITPDVLFEPVVQEAAVVVRNADTVTIDGPVTLALFESLDSNLATVVASVEDTIENILSASDSLLSLPAAIRYTDSETNPVVTVAEALRLQAIDAVNIDVASLHIVDTAANLQAISLNEDGDRGILGDVAGVTVSDNGELVGLSVEDAVAIYDNALATGGTAPTDGSFDATYSITDEYAAIFAKEMTSAVDLFDAAAVITVTDKVDASEAVVLAGIETLGTVNFSVEGAYVSGNEGALAKAQSVVFGTRDSDNKLTIDTLDATTLSNLINTDGFDFGKATYKAEFSSALLFAGMMGELELVESSKAALLNAMAVSFEADLTAEQVTLLVEAGASLSKLSYNLVDSAENLAAASASIIAAASDVTANGEATFAEASAIAGAFNKEAEADALKLNVKDASENFADASSTALKLATSISTETDDALTVAQAESVFAARGVVEGDAIVVTGTAAELAAADVEVLEIADSILPTTAISMALLTEGLPFADYTVADSFTALLDQSPASSDLEFEDIVSALVGAEEVVVTEAITIAQQAQLASILKTTEVVNSVDIVTTANLSYSIVDNDAAIAALLPNSADVLLAADSVTGSAGQALSFTETDAGVFITGTKAELEVLSADLQATKLVFQTTVAELNSDRDFFANLEGDVFVVADSLANLEAGSLILNRAVEITVEGDITAADIATVNALSSESTFIFNVVDSAKALAAATTADLEAAASVKANTVATYTEAVNLADVAGLEYSLADSIDAIMDDVDALNNAVNITVSLEKDTTAISQADAVKVLVATNTGITSLPAVELDAADLAALLASLVATDVIDSVTVADVISVGAATMSIAASDATALQAAKSAGQIKAVSYELADDAASLAAASDALLADATAIEATDRVSLELAARLDNAPASDANTLYSILDTAEAVLAASTADLARGQFDNNFIAIDDSQGITAAQATALRQLDEVSDTADGFRIGTLSGTDNLTENAGVYALADSFANLTAAANADAVADATSLTVVGDITVAQLADAEDLGTVEAYSLADTLANLLVGTAGSLELSEAAKRTDSITINETVTFEQAVLLLGKVSGFDIVDSPANIILALGNQDLVAISTFTLNSAATVAEADDIVESGIAYSLNDTAANLADAYNSVARGLVNQATSVTVSDAATVAQALGTVGVEDAGEQAGLYEIDGIQFAIEDNVEAIKSGLESVNKAGFNVASSVTAINKMAEETIDLSILDSVRGDLVMQVNGGAGNDIITLGNAQDIVELAADGTEDLSMNTEVDSVLRFDKSEDQIDLLFSLTDGSEDLSALVNSKFGGLVDGKIVTGLAATDASVVNDGAITDADLATALAAVEFAEAGDVAYLLVNATAASNTENNVVLLKVANADTDNAISEAEITQLAVITSADIDGLEVADLTANNFTDFTV